jgi:hypothetical protein
LDISCGRAQGKDSTSCARIVPERGTESDAAIQIVAMIWLGDAIKDNIGAAESLGRTRGRRAAAQPICATNKVFPPSGLGVCREGQTAM